jgi:hypothetical protein
LRIATSAKLPGGFVVNKITHQELAGLALFVRIRDEMADLTFGQQFPG